MPRKKATASKAETRKPAAATVAESVPGQGRRRLVQIISGLALAAVFLGALIAVGQWSLEQLRGQERYMTRFSDIDCVPPPGLPRSAFLDEIQYLARLPDRFSVLDESVSQTLSAAFAKHPWVEKVGSVEEHIKTLEYASKYDPLSLPAELLQIQIDLANQALSNPELLAPALEGIVRNPRFLHLAQVRAQDILQRIQ